jgi:hypothetical protein
VTDQLKACHSEPGAKPGEEPAVPPGTDKRSGITNDPNRADDPEYIRRLIGQIITVNLETVAIVRGLPPLGLPQ